MLKGYLSDTAHLVMRVLRFEGFQKRPYVLKKRPVIMGKTTGHFDQNDRSFW